MRKGANPKCLDSILTLNYFAGSGLLMRCCHEKMTSTLGPCGMCLRVRYHNCPKIQDTSNIEQAVLRKRVSKGHTSSERPSKVVVVQRNDIRSFAGNRSSNIIFPSTEQVASSECLSWSEAQVFFLRTYVTTFAYCCTCHYSGSPSLVESFPSSHFV